MYKNETINNEHRQLNEVQYLAYPFKFLDINFLLRKWDTMPNTRKQMLPVIQFRLNEWLSRSKRRFPEYTLSHTIATMGSVWQNITETQLPTCSLDASSQLIAVTYALDDIYDDPEFDRTQYDNLDVSESLNKALRAVNLSGYSGHDVINHFVSTIALDFPPRASQQREIVDETVSYLSSFHKAHVIPSIHPWNYQTALEMRKQVSGDLGKLIGKIFSYSVYGEAPTLGITAMKMMGIVGQFHDDLWDLCEENKPNTHNLFLLLAKEYNIDEHAKLTNAIQPISNRNSQMLTYDELLSYAPSTLTTYIQQMDNTLSGCIPQKETSVERLYAMKDWMVAEFEPMVRFIKRSPQRSTGNKVNSSLTRKY